LNKSKEIKIGILVSVSLALLFYGYNFLSGKDIFKKQRQYYSIYDNIGGLSENNNILVNGFAVGKINHIQFMPDGSGRILVGFYIENEMLNIPKNSVAKIESLDLLGTKAISLELSKSTDFALSGDTLSGKVEKTLQDEVNAQVKPLKEKAEELIGSIDSAVIIVQTILNKDARDNLSKSFSSIKRAIGTFEIAALRLDTMIADDKIILERIFFNIESITSNIRRSNEKISIILDNFSSISDSLSKANIAQTVSTANKTIEEVGVVFEKINNGEGSLGMLLKNDTLYRNIEQASLELDKLLEDMRINPERYVHVSVFGKKDKNPKEPKKPRP
jgi:phospholipid/cholesterol/gamma-HCH transport system substrate-binding protein